MSSYKVLAAAIIVSLGAFAQTAGAAQFTINGTDVANAFGGSGSSYIGVGGDYTWYTGGTVAGNVWDGGYDAFDGMGYLTNVGALSVMRRTEAFTGLNLYRWVDTYTNNTNNTVSQQISWWGNLGSDGYQQYVSQNAFSTVNVDNNNYDPVVAYLWGNNAFTQANMFHTGSYCEPTGTSCTDNIDIRANLTLLAGQSVSLMYFTYLTKDLVDRSGDVALAISGRDGLLLNPYLAGLSASEIANIANWGTGTSSGVPAPGALALLGLGLLGVGVFRRNRKTA